MSDVNQNLSKEGLANLAIDPDLLARELAAQLAGDPLDEIELDKTDEDLVNSSKECERPTGNANANLISGYPPVNSHKGPNFI